MYPIYFFRSCLSHSTFFLIKFRVFGRLASAFRNDFYFYAYASNHPALNCCYKWRKKHRTVRLSQNYIFFILQLLFTILKSLSRKTSPTTCLMFSHRSKKLHRNNSTSFHQQHVFMYFGWSLPSDKALRSTWFLIFSIFNFTFDEKYRLTFIQQKFIRWLSISKKVFSH